MKASIVIPSYNAKERLYYNLTALNYQNYPFHNFEVIVIDNGSTDDTTEMLSKFSSHYPLINIRLEKNKGIAYARNKGILKASGDIIIFHDSDMIARKDFVRKHIEAHEKKNTVICGLCWKKIYSFYYRNFDSDHLKQLQDQYPSLKIINKNIQPLITEEQIINGNFINYSFDLDNAMITSLKSVLQTFGEDLSGYKFPWRYFITNNASVARNTLLDIGLFDDKNENWGFEDFDLAIRLHKSGYKFKVRHDIVNIHQEHPVNYTFNQFKDSVHYMFEKYNDIKHLDFLLILFSVTTSLVPPVKTIIDDNALNEVMQDIDDMIESKDQLELLNLFRELLLTLSKKHLDTKSSMKRLNRKKDLAKLNEMESELQKKTGSKHFVHALLTLIREID